MSTIYIKYDGLEYEDCWKLCEELGSTFRNYSWGAGFSLKTFRCDPKYFYVDLVSTIFSVEDEEFVRSERYIQGVLTGYLIKCGVEIL